MTPLKAYWIDTITTLIPLYRDIVFYAFILILLLSYRKSISSISNTVLRRIARGDGFKTPLFSFDPHVNPDKLTEALPSESVPSTQEDSVDHIMPEISIPKSIKEWSRYRFGIYGDNKNFFLVHTLRPSKKKGQTYEAFIYVIGHKDTSIGVIQKADFFLGHHWGNKIFTATPRDGLIGIRTSMYGPVLCVCKLYVEDNDVVEEIMIERYIDFELADSIDWSNVNY